MNKFIWFILMTLMIPLIVLGCGKSIKFNNNKNSEIVQREKSNKKDEKGKKNSKQLLEENFKKTSNSDSIKEQIDKMNLDEKIGQMIMTGVEGYTICNNDIKMIKDYHVGGFIIMGRNIRDANQLLDLVNSLKTINLSNKIPLFLSIDQEGGRVDRMPAELKKLPSNKIVGRVDNIDFSYKLGKIISEELNLFGLNMDFAPVLDINNNPNNTVVGDRSFGSNPNIVAKLGIQTMNGIKSGNIIPIVKHFPGHGDTSVDSHIGLPLVNNDMKEIESFELVPFTQAVENNVDGIMVAHILFPKIDNRYPASMSKRIITDILRKDLKFDGVVITDDMTMGAITKNYNIGDAAVKSVNAGSDIILVCHVYDNQIRVINALKEAVQNDVITEERINQSVYRILKLKRKYKINNNIIKSITVDKVNSKINTVLKNYIK